MWTCDPGETVSGNDCAGESNSYEYITVESDCNPWATPDALRITDLDWNVLLDWSRRICETGEDDDYISKRTELYRKILVGRDLEFELPMAMFGLDPLVIDTNYITDAGTTQQWEERWSYDSRTLRKSDNACLAGSYVTMSGDCTYGGSHVENRSDSFVRLILEDFDWTAWYC